MSNNRSISSILKQKLLDSQQQNLTDVTLVSSDGEIHHSVRFILKLRSQYFEAMFSSDFKETQSNEIKVELSSKVLRNVLEFMYTDDCHAIRQLFLLVDDVEVTRASSICYSWNKKPEPAVFEIVYSIFQPVLELMRAGDYLLFPELVNSSYIMIVKSVIRYPFLFCTVWEALWGKSGFRPEPPEPKHPYASPI